MAVPMRRVASLKLAALCPSTSIGLSSALGIFIDESGLALGPRRADGNAGRDAVCKILDRLG